MFLHAEYVRLMRGDCEVYKGYVRLGGKNCPPGIGVDSL